MITYFKKLLNYDYNTNSKIIDSMLAAGINSGKPAELMGHTLAAQERWLIRCKNKPVPDDPLWPVTNVNEMKAINNSQYQQWNDFLNSLSDTDIKNTITYSNTKGEVFTNTLEDILAHLFNHGTHHRAQIGVYLKQAGADIPPTDYIFHIRQHP